MKNTWFFVLSATSLADMMLKAALNTVIAMSIVFCVLILIIFVISAFKIIPYLEEKRKEKEAVQNQFVAQIEQREEQREEPIEEFIEETEALEDDMELVAAIAAAIAAYTGTSTSDFVVRSIKRR